MSLLNLPKMVVKSIFASMTQTLVMGCVSDHVLPKIACYLNFLTKCNLTNIFLYLLVGCIVFYLIKLIKHFFYKKHHKSSSSSRSRSSSNSSSSSVNGCKPKPKPKPSSISSSSSSSSSKSIVHHKLHNKPKHKLNLLNSSSSSSSSSLKKNNKCKK